MSECSVSCSGLYADVNWIELIEEDNKKHENILLEYSNLKNSFSENLKFDPEIKGFGKSSLLPIDHLMCFILAHKKPAYLHLVKIYFKTSTFDIIERDVKMTVTDIVGSPNHAFYLLLLYYLQVLLVAPWGSSPVFQSFYLLSFKKIKYSLLIC